MKIITSSDDHTTATMERQAKIQATLKRKVPPLSSFVVSYLKVYDYVDKSILLASLMAHAETYLFIPSMRRCGKSFTLKLLQAMAEGKRDALSGLRICTVPNSADWQLPTEGNEYRVIKLDFSFVHPYYDIKDGMARYLRQAASVAIPESLQSTSEILKHWIETVAAGQEEKVVVLVDEYDAPLTPFLGDPEKLQSITAELKMIFMTLKGLDGALFKAIVTGGLKAGMSGLFSGANNFYRLLDEEPAFSGLFGFTADEIRGTYGGHIQEIFQPTSLDESMKTMAEYYNGYRFHPKDEETYFNPWSTISYLRAARLDRYWAYTCASSVLDKIILHHGPDALAGCRLHWKGLQQPLTMEDYTDNWISLFFQSGYLSIFGWDNDNEADGVVLLSPPNHEVREYLESQIPRLLRIEAEQRGHWPSMLQYSSSMSTFQFDEAAEILTKVLNDLRYDLLNENEFGGWALHSLRLMKGFLIHSY